MSLRIAVLTSASAGLGMRPERWEGVVMWATVGEVSDTYEGERGLVEGG